MAGPVVKLDLGVNFDSLGKDLTKVGDSISALGARHTLKIGAVVSDLSKGGLDPSKLGEAVSQVGTKLAVGVQAGARESGALMLGLTAHINTMLDRLAGAAITLFRRIDSSMKFPAVDTALKSAQLKLTNFTKVIGRGPLSNLDLALQGGMGKTAQTQAKIFKDLFDRLAATLKDLFSGLAKTLGDELGAVSAAMGAVVGRLGEARTAAAGVVPIFGEMAAAAQKVAAAPPPSILEGPIPPRPQVPGTGRRLKVAEHVGRMTSAALANAPAVAPNQRLPVAPTVAPTQMLPVAPAVAPVRPDLFAGLRSAGVEAAAAVGRAWSAAAPALASAGAAAGAAAAVAGKAWRPATVAVTAFGTAVGLSLRTAVQVGAALVSVPLRGVIAFGRLKNFLSSLGDVGKKSFHDLYESQGAFLAAVSIATRPVRALISSLGILSRLNPFHKAEAGARAATLSVGGLVEKARSAGSSLALAFGVVGAGVGSVLLLKSAVKAASDLNETVSRTRTVFGDAFGEVQAQATQMNRAFGTSVEQQLDIASGFGAMAQGAGLSEAASADLANTMTRMAADLSSSVNIPFEEAGQKIRSALAGQSEPLRQFGVLIDEDAVKAHALASGLAASKDAISNQAKVVARAELVMRGLSYAQGDLERTADSPANQMRKLAAQFDAIKLKVGQALLPGVTMATQALSRLGTWVADAWERNKGVIDGFTKVFAGAVASVRDGALRIFTAFGGIPGALDSAFGEGSTQSVTLFAGALGEKVTRAVEFVGSVIRNLPEYFALASLGVQLEVARLEQKFFEFRERLVRDWEGLSGQIYLAIETALLRVYEKFTEFQQKFTNLGVTLGNEFRKRLGLAPATPEPGPIADTKKLAGSGKPQGNVVRIEAAKDWQKSLETRMEGLWATIGKSDVAFGAKLDADLAKLAGAGAAAGPKKPGPLEEGGDKAAEKPAEYKLAGAVEISSKEAYSAIARNAAGGARGTTGAVQKVNQTAQQIVAGVKETTGAVKALGAGPRLQVK